MQKVIILKYNSVFQRNLKYYIFRRIVSTTFTIFSLLYIVKGILVAKKLLDDVCFSHTHTHKRNQRPEIIYKEHFNIFDVTNQHLTN